MDIQELNKQLDYLEETKNLMKQTLINKGQPVDDNTTFREYIDNMDILIDTEDGDVTADVLGKDKIAYGVNGKVVGTIPVVEANNSAILNKTEDLSPSGSFKMETTYKNVNDGTVTELIMTDGKKLDISTLPENVDNKNIFVIYGVNKYNTIRWFLFITDIGNSICLASHDYTYAVVCKNKSTRATNKDMVYYKGSTPYNADVPFDINNVDWGEQIVWDKSTAIELNLSQQGLTIYTTDTIYRGQFGSYGSEQFAGNLYYKYYQENKIGKPANSGLIQNSSQLFKENSYALIPINTKNIVSQENITADKIKSGETILGITGTYTGSTMKEYTSETDMNNDIANISDGEVVKVVESGTTSYFIKEIISGTATMTKLVKESETMSPQEYNTANDIADEILGE